MSVPSTRIGTTLGARPVLVAQLLLRGADVDPLEHSDRAASQGEVDVDPAERIDVAEPERALDVVADGVELRVGRVRRQLRIGTDYAPVQSGPRPFLLSVPRPFLPVGAAT